MRKKPIKRAYKRKLHTGISVGVQKDSIIEARNAILAILNIKDVEAIARVEALRTLATLCQVNNTTITHCTIGV